MDKIFGKDHPEIYISFVILLTVLICGGIMTYLFKDDKQFVGSMWSLFVPAITMVLGYMFGKKQ